MKPNQWKATSKNAPRPTAIEQFNKARQEWTAPSSSSSRGFNFVIGTGDGELFRITTKVTP